jgi:choline dehydrogenase-like flavoprotein
MTEGRKLSRRQFLRLLSRGAAAAMVVQGMRPVLAMPTAAPDSARGLLSEKQAATLAKVIDAFVPVDSELRRRLAAEDPDYDFVVVFERFCFQSGVQFADNAKLLLDLVDLLPTFMPLFFSRWGLPTFRLTRLGDDDAQRFFRRLRDSRLKALRSIFQGAKALAMQPVYCNEKSVWPQIGYRPWLEDSAELTADSRRPTAFEMAIEVEDGLATLRGNVLSADTLERRLRAGVVRRRGDRFVVETDVVVVGSGAGGAVVAAEVAANTGQRVLVLEKGHFVEPMRFTQRESEMVPALYEVEFSSVDLKAIDRQVPTMSSTIVRGALVGGSATINHALAFETPGPVIDEWRRDFGARFSRADLQPHFDAVRSLLRVKPVDEIQIGGNNALLRQGALALGARHHGIADRNAHQCIGCGCCDMGCRYNRKLTPLNVLLPRAAAHGAQVLADCRVEEILLEDLAEPVGGRRVRAVGVKATLVDKRGPVKGTVEVRARRVVLCAGPLDSPRVLLRSGVDRIRRRTGGRAAIGEALSTHAPVTLYGEFDRPFYPTAGGPPMSYYVKQYEGDGDPESAHVEFAVEGIFNHPMVHSQLVPFETPAGHAAFMRRYNRTMTVAILLRDRAVGRVRAKTFEYELAAADRPRLLDAMRMSARLMFAAGARRVFLSDVQPFNIGSATEIDEKLTMRKMERDPPMITSGHPMGGCRLGEDPARDVVDSDGRSWDVDGLFIADSSVFPTSLGVNPCFTVYALAHRMAKAIAAPPYGAGRR